MNETKTTMNFFKIKNSKRERWTETIEETWLVENGEKVKLISKTENIRKELISEGNEVYRV